MNSLCRWIKTALSCMCNAINNHSWNRGTVFLNSSLKPCMQNSWWSDDARNINLAHYWCTYSFRWESIVFSTPQQLLYHLQLVNKHFPAILPICSGFFYERKRKYKSWFPVLMFRVLKDWRDFGYSITIFMEKNSSVWICV